MQLLSDFPPVYTVQSYTLLVHFWPPLIFNSGYAYGRGPGSVPEPSLILCMALCLSLDLPFFYVYFCSTVFPFSALTLLVG